MIALVILLALGLWVGLGVWIWKHVLRRVLADPVLLLLGTLLFAAVWLLAPWADEYLGQKEFARLCAAMPDTQFLGPVSVGEGPFFDAQGRPKWATRQEFDAITNGEVIYDPQRETLPSSIRCSPGLKITIASPIGPCLCWNRSSPTATRPRAKWCWSRTGAAHLVVGSSA